MAIGQFRYVTEILISKLESDEMEMNELKETLNLCISQRQLLRCDFKNHLDEHILTEKIKDCQYEYHSLRIEMIEIRKVLQMMTVEKEQKRKNLPSACRPRRSSNIEEHIS